MNDMNNVIGVNFDPDNLFTDLVSGNASLGVGPVLGLRDIHNNFVFLACSC